MRQIVRTITLCAAAALAGGVTLPGAAWAAALVSPMGPATGDMGRAPLILIQDEPPNDRYEYEPEPEGRGTPTFVPLNDGLTDGIVLQLTQAKELCGRLPWPYRVDCMSDQFARLARSLPSKGAYGQVRRALFEASEDLRKLAENNRDPDEPEIMVRLSTAGGARSSRPLVPVAPAKRAEVARKAEAIIAEASTVLLRSAENSEDRMLHFAQVAQAIDSTKVLLRSA